VPIMVRVIINFKNESVISKIRNYGKVIYASDLLNVIAHVPENKLRELKKITDVEKISFPGKADVLIKKSIREQHGIQFH
jgi:hypothetical protein